MLMALGAASAAWDTIQKLASSSASSSTQSTGFFASGADPFEMSGSASPQAASPQTAAPKATGFSTTSTSQIAPATMQALLAAQGQSSTTTSASESPKASLQDLFSQIDGNGDGQITKSEFESALGAGGTNLAQADDVFSKLDANGDGSVDLSELSQALKGSGKGGGHGHHAGGSSSSSTDPSTDPFLQALQASSAAASNDNSLSSASLIPANTSSLTPVSLGASGAATMSYNAAEQMFQRGSPMLALHA
ncbi:EF-hand domain-containing protein [Bradyrhizobium sp. dw_78]|uniref:EF-hand domain-containing protein n=1 Tax=Bradyrhizobium sp. dw_78 TaxID=2719793 RepID=UPI001BD5B651|nr:EF-hand domain-containing protein [Bradyrhizobium sp. dw_78]